MISYVSRSGNLAPFLRATSHAVASQANPVLPTTVVAAEKIIIPSTTKIQTSYGLSKTILTGPISVTSGVGTSTQVRYAHTDVRAPDFSHYLKNADPAKKEDRSYGYTYVSVVGGVAATYLAKETVVAFVSSMSASAEQLAMGQIEIKLGDIPEGKCMTFKWRGKPLFIRHRSQDEVSRERGVVVSSLRDPQQDEERTKRPEWLVVIGVCTHLGCVPIANSGDFGGFYCPCHGSHYDASGRIRKGPAPLNLEVPPYEFPSDDVVLVG
jgi:ubiquinol-cytochrome c reductase iron-sulfur subunit